MEKPLWVSSKLKSDVVSNKTKEGAGFGLLKRTYLIKSEYTARNNYMGDWRCVRGCILGIFFLCSGSLIIRHALGVPIDDVVSIKMKGNHEKIQ